jgi:hypothetical protein
MNVYFSNKQKAELHRANYEEWKGKAFDQFGFFPIFQPFKESFLLSNLSGNALRLYIYLGLMSGNLTGETWVSIDTVSKYFDKSPRAVSSWFRELESAKLIERLQFKHNEVSHTFLMPYGEGRLK